MVFFTCNACGESLKKAQIPKHTSMCRGCQVLSCIDCGKDFWGEDYKSHVKCISEDQKYGGKNYEAKANKGDVKQQQWIQRVQTALDKPGVSARLRSVLQQVATYDNVPRKKAKFQNWIKNSLKIYDSSLQNQVWEIFSSSESPQDNGAEQPVHASPPAQDAQDTQEEQAKPQEKKKNKRERKEERQKQGKKKRSKEEQNGENGVAEPQKKKKRKRAEEEESVEEESLKKMKKRKEEKECEERQNLEEVEKAEEQEAQENTKGKFNWKGTIKAVLRQAPEEGIALKKLRKKVLSAYYSFSAEDNHKSEEELYTLFNKKLKNPKFKILKEKVRLVN